MRRWLAAFAFDWSVIAASIAVVDRWPSVPTFILAAVLIGTRQHGIAVLAHDGAHRSIRTRHRWLNDGLAWLAFAPLGIDLENYREFHLAHHRYLGTGKDPELALKRAAGTWRLPTSKWEIGMTCAADLLVWPALREMIPFIGIVTSPRAVACMVIFEAALFLVGGPWAITLWLSAICTTFWASNRLRIWTEHQGTQGTWRVSATWWQRFLFLPHNIGYHYEHHVFATQPFYLLPATRIYWRDYGSTVSVGDLFRMYRRN